MHFYFLWTYLVILKDLCETKNPQRYRNTGWLCIMILFLSKRLAGPAVVTRSNITVLLFVFVILWSPCKKPDILWVPNLPQDDN